MFKENDEREIHYREKDGLLLPYIKIELKNACSAVNKITVAPQNHVDLAKEGMEMYARQLGYDAQVCLSKIKLRYCFGIIIVLICKRLIICRALSESQEKIL